MIQTPILTSRIIREDCVFLENIQLAFPNIKIILCDDITPYIHLYKNEDEAFTFNADHVREDLTEKEYNNILSFNNDEKIAILINSINSYLIDKMYDERKSYILFYCGTWVSTRDISIDDNLVCVPRELLTRLKLLEIK